MKYIAKNYTIIESEEQYEAMMAHIESSEYVAYDVESNGLNTRKHQVIGVGVCGEPGTAFYLPLAEWNLNRKILEFFEYEQGTLDRLFAALSKKKLLMHNASFDVRITKNDLKYDLLQAVYADTMLLKHTVNEERPFGLKDIAIQFKDQLGIDAEEEANAEQIELKANIEKNGGSATKEKYELYKADLAIIGKYCNADCDLTLRIFHLLSKDLKRQNLEEFYYDMEVMPLYKEVTIPMESGGLPLNLSLLEQTNHEITLEIEHLEKEVRSALLPYAKKLEKHLLEKAHPPKKGGKFGQMLAAMSNLDLPKTKTGNVSLTAKTLEKIPDSSVKQFLLTGEECHLSAEKILEVQRRVYFEKNGDASFLNISSKAHLGYIIFDTLKEKPLGKTPGGKPQMNVEMVEHLKDKYDWAYKLHEYNMLCKIKSSYIDRFLAQHENGVFYPSFNQHRTISGRYGSDLQQLPRTKEEDSGLTELVLKYVNLIRELFISGEGWKYIDDDYSSLEPTIFAHDSGDKAIQDVFNKGYDLYSTVAIGAENLSGVSADKSAPNFLKTVMPEKRQHAKAYTLGIRYGMKAFKLSKTLDIKIERASRIIDNYFSQFPGLKTAMDSALDMAKTHGMVMSEFGRIRHMPRAKYYYERYGDRLLDFKWANARGLKKERVDYNGLLNNALNFPIQSAAASVVNRAAIAIAREFKKRDIQGYICAQVHDQLICRVQDDYVEEAKKIVQDCMENTTKLSVPLVAKPEVAINLREGH